MKFLKCFAFTAAISMCSISCEKGIDSELQNDDISSNTKLSDEAFQDEYTYYLNNSDTSVELDKELSDIIDTADHIYENPESKTIYILTDESYESDFKKLHPEFSDEESSDQESSEEYEEYEDDEEFLTSAKSKKKKKKKKPALKKNDRVNLWLHFIDLDRYLFIKHVNADYDKAAKFEGSIPLFVNGKSKGPVKEIATYKIKDALTEIHTKKNRVKFMAVNHSAKNKSIHLYSKRNHKGRKFSLLVKPHNVAFIHTRIKFKPKSHKN